MYIFSYDNVIDSVKNDINMKILLNNYINKILKLNINDNVKKYYKWNIIQKNYKILKNKLNPNNNNNSNNIILRRSTRSHIKKN